HTLLAWQLPGAHRVHKVTIVPRGRSLGSTQTLPAEDRLSISEPELRDHLAVLLAGRAAWSGELQNRRRRSLPRPRDAPAAAIQRSDDGNDRSGSRSHPPRGQPAL